MKATAPLQHRKLIFRTLSGLLVFAVGAASAWAAEPAPETKTIEYLRTLTLRTVVPESGEADPGSPWQAHLGHLNIRDIPSQEGKILGKVKGDEEMSGVYYVVDETDEEWLEVEIEGRKGYVSRIGLNRVHPANQQAITSSGNLPFGEEIVDRWWGIPIGYEPDDLVALLPPYTSESDQEMRLRAEAADHLTKMIDAMRKAGLDIYVSSAYRDGLRQRRMFVRAGRKRLNQRHTAPPGHSEHQLGTTVDLSLTREFRRALRNSDPQHDWLEKHAKEYGWKQTYHKGNSKQTGYIEEPWHWRYVGQ